MLNSTFFQGCKVLPSNNYFVNLTSNMVILSLLPADPADGEKGMERVKRVPGVDVPKEIGCDGSSLEALSGLVTSG